MIRLVFLHGLEGSPQGRKPSWLRAAGFEVTAPTLPTQTLMPYLGQALSRLPEHSFAEALAVAQAAVEATRPEVLIGSSFGGGLAVELCHRGLWRGPLVLLAPAARRAFGHDRLPALGARAAVLHGRFDDIVPPQDSLELAARSRGDVELTLVDDDHRLAASVDRGLMGRLIHHVLEKNQFDGRAFERS